MLECVVFVGKWAQGTNCFEVIGMIIALWCIGSILGSAKVVLVIIRHHHTLIVLSLANSSSCEI